MNIRVKTLAVLLVALVLAACATLPLQAPRVSVVSGELRGAAVDGVYAFKGVPYAAAPIGDRRWRAPQPAEPWQGVRDARGYAPHCAQPESAAAGFEQQPMSEDCLTVNIWSPTLDPGKSLPVMVWIHGGGYSIGSGNKSRSNSPALARDGVVLVTLNYRLSAFGFLVHPAFAATQPGEINGNYGLQDVVAALRWVQQNIAAFGGDPDNVTIFGESAGAGLVNSLLVMPDATGLFHKAISQSASVGLAPDPYPEKRAGFLPPAARIGEGFAKTVGVTDDMDDAATVAWLRSLSSEKILAAVSDRDRYTPVIDGQLLPDQVATLLASGRFNAVPYITGGNSWEASLGRMIGGGFSPEFSARLLTAQQKAEYYPGLADSKLEDAIFGDLIILSGSAYVARQMQAAGQPVYRYYLSYMASERRGAQPGVAHEEDIAFVMQTLPTELTEISPGDAAMSRLISGYWAQFARSGDPNFAGAPIWPAYSADSDAVLELGDEIAVREGLFADRMTLHIDRGLELLERARN